MRGLEYRPSIRVDQRILHAHNKTHRGYKYLVHISDCYKTDQNHHSRNELSLAITMLDAKFASTIYHGRGRATQNKQSTYHQKRKCLVWLCYGRVVKDIHKVAGTV